MYCLNAARHVFGGEPIEIQAMTGSDRSDPRFAEVDAGISATMRFDGGRIASFYAGFGSDATDMFHVVGTQGSLEFQHAYLFGTERTILLRRGSAVEQIDIPETDNFSGMVAYFSDCILEGTPPRRGQHRRLGGHACAAGDRGRSGARPSVKLETSGPSRRSSRRCGAASRPRRKLLLP